MIADRSEYGLQLRVSLRPRRPTSRGVPALQRQPGHAAVPRPTEVRVSGVLHGSPLPLSRIDRGVLAALAVVALLHDDAVMRAVVGELAARLVSASSGAEVYAATYGAVLFASGVLGAGARA